MDNQTPDEFEDDTPAPDFLQLMLSRQHQFPISKPDDKDEEFSPPQHSQLEPPIFPASETDLDRWAAQRAAVYTTLNDALNRHFDDAINALSELKRQAEAQAAQASYKLVLERDRLKQEVTILQHEQIRLQQRIQESRRVVEAEEARQEQAKIEREELDKELNWLKIQIEEARRSTAASTEDMRSEARHSARRSQHLLARSILPAVPVFDETAFARPAPEVAPAAPPPPAINQPASADDTEDIVEVAAPAVSVAFGDKTTPRIPGGSPILTPVIPVQAALPLPAETPVRARPANVITASTFAYLQELLMGETPHIPDTGESGPTPALEPVSLANTPRVRTGGTGPLRFGAADLGKTGELPRRAQTDQLGVTRRRRTTRPLVPETVSEPVTPPPPPVVETAAAPLQSQFTTPAPEVRLSRVTTLTEAERSQKVILRELGIQLGLEETSTPPTINMINFAEGYTPSQGNVSLAALLDEIKANASAITPLPETIAAPDKPGKKVVEPPPPVSLDQDLEDYNIEDVRPNPTLQELLEAGETEMDVINDDQTPPENPTPFIGKIGPDHPVVFQPGPTITPKPEPLTALNETVEYKVPVAQTSKPAVVRRIEPINPAPAPRPFRPLGVRPLRPRPVEMPVRPPVLPAIDASISFPLSIPYEDSLRPDETVRTEVTLLNLHGRYSLQMLEHVLNGLVGVGQVAVTRFGGGTMVMNITHQPELNLIAQMIALPQLPLRLKEEGDGILVFVQEDSPGDSS